jgi:transcriptional regulator with XRE-family HTH domain
MQQISLSAAMREVAHCHAMSLGDLIRSKRNEAGLSQAQLAKMIPVSPGAVAQWELGQTGPSVENMARLREVLRIDAGAQPSSIFPNGYEFVEEPEKLAWLRLFDLMSETDRLIAMRMIRGAVTPKT